MISAGRMAGEHIDGEAKLKDCATMDDFSRIGVVGAGFMGSGIAESAAAAQIEVTVFEPDQAPLDRSRKSLEASVAKAASRGKLSRDDADALIGRVHYTRTFEELDDVDCVIEAVTEDPRVKGKLFAQLDRELPGARFLASNTSSIPVAELGAWTERPDRVIGLHF